MNKVSYVIFYAISWELIVGYMGWLGVDKCGVEGGAQAYVTHGIGVMF